jgi:hypothetical protein
VTLALTRPVAPPAARADGPLYFDTQSLEVLEPVAASATTPRSNTVERLGRKLDRFMFRKAPLEQVLDDFRRRADVNLVVDWAGLDEDGIRKATPVTLDLSEVPAGLALRLALDEAWRNRQGPGRGPDVGYRVEYGVVFVGTGAGGIRGRSLRTVVRVYDIRDLMMESARFSDSFLHSLPAATRLPAGAQETAATDPQPNLPGVADDEARPPATEVEAFSRLAEVIITAIDPESWEDSSNGVDGRIRYWAGRAIVFQTPENQEMVESFFRDLRAELRAQRQADGARK